MQGTVGSPTGEKDPTRRHGFRSTGMAVVALAVIALSGCGGQLAPQGTTAAPTSQASLPAVPTPSDWSQEAVAELFERGQVAMDGTDVRITSAGGPGGLSITFPPLHAGKALLSVQGRTKTSGVSLRLQARAAAPAYYNAPDGELLLVVDGRSATEVLIYADKTFEYLVESLTLEPCPDCHTDEELRADILADIPRLAEKLEVDPEAAAELLLHWTAPRVNWALDPSLVGPSERRLATLPSAANALYEVAGRASYGGVYCGGAAVVYDRILKLFGFDSFTMNFGDRRGDLTHSTVVVPLLTGDTTRFVIFDPSFNATFRDSSGKHVDVLDLAKRAAASSLAGVVVEAEPMPERKYVFRDASPRPSQCTSAPTPEGDQYSCRVSKFGLEEYLLTFSDALVRHGYPTTIDGFGQLLRREVFGVGTSRDPALPALLLERLADLGVVVPA